MVTPRAHARARGYVIGRGGKYYLLDWILDSGLDWTLDSGLDSGLDS